MTKFKRIKYWCMQPFVVMSPDSCSEKTCRLLKNIGCCLGHPATWVKGQKCTSPFFIKAHSDSSVRVIVHSPLPCAVSSSSKLLLLPLFSGAFSSSSSWWSVVATGAFSSCCYWCLFLLWWFCLVDCLRG